MTILSLIFSAYALGMWVQWLLPRPGAFVASTDQSSTALASQLEGPLYRMLLGLIIASLIILIAGSLSLAAAWWLVAVLAVAGAGLCGRDIRHAMPNRTQRERLDWIERLSLAAAAAGLGFAFVCALAPVTGWDAGVAHIALPADYVRNGHIGLIDGNNYSAYPHLMHALFALAYCSGERSVSLVSWSFGALACGMAYLLGARIEGRKCGFIAAAVLATAPIFVDQAGAPSLDLAFTATVLAALHALAAWRQERNTNWLVLAGLIAGAGCGIRHTGYLVAAILAGFVLADGGPRRLRSAYIFSFACAAAALPWLMRSAANSGNPFYPFFASLFGPAALPDVDAAAILTHSSIQGTGVADFVLFPFNVVLNPLRYGGWMTSPGILILALGIPGLFTGGSEARRLGAFSGAGIACMFFFRRFARYLLPFFAPLMVVAAIAVCRANRLRGPMLAVLLAGFGLGLAPGAAMTAIRFPAALGLESRDEFLTRRVERYPAFAWANAHLDPDGTVLTLDPRGYYFNRATFVNFEALKPLVVMDKSGRLDWLRAHRILYVLYPEAYVQESPAFRETGVIDVLDAWRADQEHFELIARFELQRPRTTATETVEIYTVHAAPLPGR
jgi:hypothetical protein